MIAIERKPHLEIIQSKIYNLEHLVRQRAVWKFQSKKVVFTNGCFDLLHRGHAEYLSKAADLGDIVIVGLNTDTSVKGLKGEGRPIQDETTRALLLASLQFIDAVILFEEETPYNLISNLLPDVLVKGKDYAPEQIAGYDVVMANGGQVLTVDLTDGFSTSCIVKKLSHK
jgi:D-glycero-beta-D-manno-heptose 1-phosphate adenylyltransferase